MIVSLQEALDFCDVENLEFIISGNNNVLYFKYDGGSATKVSLTNNTYNGDSLATHLQTQINTALTSNVIVTWSSYKFTIVESGHTIQYIEDNSTAGYDIGFTEDSAVAASISSDTEVSDPTAIINTIRGQADAFVKRYCRRDFEETVHNQITKVIGDKIPLDDFPVNSISRVSLGAEDVLGIYNTNSSSYATVSFNGTSVVLNYNGSESSLAIATYTTIGTLATAINAISGWVAETQGNYSSWLTSELLEEYGLGCLEDQRAYLRVRTEPASNFKVNLEIGVIYLPYVINNRWCYVDYTAGFATIPEDLKLATLALINSIYEKYQDRSFDLDGFKIADISKYTIQAIPNLTLKILDSYKRY